MGKENDVVLEYLDGNEYFADPFNGSYFDGDPVVTAKELEEVDRETASAAGKLLGITPEMEVVLEQEGEEIDMCTGLKEWLMDERSEGREEGRAEGRVETVISLVKSGLLKLEEAATFLNLSIEDMQRNVAQE